MTCCRHFLEKKIDSAFLEDTRLEIWDPNAFQVRMDPAAMGSGILDPEFSCCCSLIFEKFPTVHASSVHHACGGGVMEQA